MISGRDPENATFMSCKKHPMLSESVSCCLFYSIFFGHVIEMIKTEKF